MDRPENWESVIMECSMGQGKSFFCATLTKTKIARRETA